MVCRPVRFSSPRRVNDLPDCLSSPSNPTQKGGRRSPRHRTPSEETSARSPRFPAIDSTMSLLVPPYFSSFNLHLIPLAPISRIASPSSPLQPFHRAILRAPEKHELARHNAREDDRDGRRITWKTHNYACICGRDGRGEEGDEEEVVTGRDFLEEGCCTSGVVRAVSILHVCSFEAAAAAPEGVEEDG